MTAPPRKAPGQSLRWRTEQSRVSEGQRSPGGTALAVVKSVMSVVSWPTSRELRNRSTAIRAWTWSSQLVMPATRCTGATPTPAPARPGPRA